jgi:Rrf2 family protein
MAFISSGVEYALHCLIFLKDRPDAMEGIGVRDLAKLQDVPAEYLAKLFTKLSKAGIVNAIEGVRGGFTLARQPASITVLDVVRAIDGQKNLFECREIRAHSALFEADAPEWATHGVCGIHAVMLAAEQKMLEELAKHTLKDIFSRFDDIAPADFNGKVVRWLSDRSDARPRRRA